MQPSEPQSKYSNPLLYSLPHRLATWPKYHSLLTQIASFKISKEVPAIEILQKIVKIMNQFDECHWSTGHLRKYKMVDNEKEEKGKEVQKEEKGSQEVIVDLLQFAARMALQVETIFQRDLPISVPLGEQGMSWITLSKRQALCLVCNMFYCTIQHQNQASQKEEKQSDKKTKTDRKFKNMPIYVNFRRLSRQQNEVVRTTFNYFKRCKKVLQTASFSTPKIVYIRISQSPIFQSWLSCQTPLCSVQFHKTGLLEQSTSSINIDFANKSIGGFFLSATYTQQDIIFINCPQLMPALLFHQYMADNQAILMVGAQRYSLYQGYLDTYQFKCDFVDQRENVKVNLGGDFVEVKDSWISAIDAIPYFVKSEYEKENLNRQLCKAYTGFNIRKLDGGTKAIATGNWGSGAFNGNLQYKFLIQWLACSRAERKMEYYSFMNGQASLIPQIYDKFKHLTVGELCKIICAQTHYFQAKPKAIFEIMLNYHLTKAEKIQQKVQELEL